MRWLILLSFTPDLKGFQLRYQDKRLQVMEKIPSDKLKIRLLFSGNLQDQTP